nr:MAG TPA: hypothetical protein [Caudoviricetes sp.]
MFLKQIQTLNYSPPLGQKNARNVVKSTVLTFACNKFVFQRKKVIQNLEERS